LGINGLITIASLFGSWSAARSKVSWLNRVQQSIRTHISCSVSEILWRYTICWIFNHTSM